MNYADSTERGYLESNPVTSHGEIEIPMGRVLLAQLPHGRSYHREIPTLILVARWRIPTFVLAGTNRQKAPRAAEGTDAI
jgi:hypothetical protein